MSAEVLVSNGNLVTVRLTGKLTESKLSTLQHQVGKLIEELGKVRLIVLLENYTGWQEGGAWGDLSFQLEHDGHIEKMAIIGDRKWKDPALIFTAKSIRKFPIEYFEPAEKEKALAWLANQGSTQLHGGR